MGDYIERFVFTKDGEDLCLLIEADPDAESPRSWENMGHMYCWHNRYNLGDENPYDEPADFLEAIEDIPEDDIVMIRVDMLDHSGLVIYAAGSMVYDDPWDSGQIGWIYATREDAEAWGCPWDNVEKQLLAELDAYSKYIAGDCLVGIICELEEGWEEDNIEAYIAGVRDSCGGLYTKEVWGLGLAEEVLETMGYGDYTTLVDI